MQKPVQNFDKTVGRSFTIQKQDMLQIKKKKGDNVSVQCGYQKKIYILSVHI